MPAPAKKGDVVHGSYNGNLDDCSVFGTIQDVMPSAFPPDMPVKIGSA